MPWSRRSPSRRETWPRKPCASLEHNGTKKAKSPPCMPWALPFMRSATRERYERCGRPSAPANAMTCRIVPRWSAATSRCVSPMRARRGPRSGRSKQHRLRSKASSGLAPRSSGSPSTGSQDAVPRQSSVRRRHFVSCEASATPSGRRECSITAPPSSHCSAATARPGQTWNVRASSIRRWGSTPPRPTPASNLHVFAPRTAITSVVWPSSTESTSRRCPNGLPAGSTSAAQMLSSS